MNGMRRCPQQLLIAFLVSFLSACGTDTTGPDSSWGTSISGRWIAETETAAMSLEIGWFTQTCYQSDFGGRGCVSKANVTGSITANGQTSAIRGEATTSAPTYDGIELTAVDPVERTAANCLVDRYYAVVKPASEGVSAQILSYCSTFGQDASSRTQTLIMRRP